ncbi:uncharacterized protein [Gossypium hirsutum]|uniref:DUF7745 domain-containing protein n=1 Tax=Gossypium hirsutum TaxID=3635 RepID=A0A1U8MVU2_GOSHI|nr:uncharacterized protein LOC107940762 [Gossypium hirsutum]
MGNGFLDRVEDNAAVRTWSEKIQREKGDSLAVGYVSELWGFTRVDKRLFRALAQFWNPAYNCFTFGKVDLVPTIEEYTALLRCSKVQWVTARIKQKRDSRCIPWKSLRDLILAHPDTRKKVDIFALSIYGLIVFPKILGHIDEAVTDLFNRLDKRVTPVPVILAETFRSLNACRRTGEGRFIGCAQLLLAWFHSHFWKVDKVSYRVFSESYSLLKEIVAASRRDGITKEKWMAIFQNLQEENIEWRASWLLPDEILYQCGDFDWVSLLGIWGTVGYAPLLVLRQYRSRQFVPATQRLAECEFSYKNDGYKRKAREMANAWNQTRQIKRLDVGPMTTSKYSEWCVRRINDNIPGPGPENSQSIEEHLRVVPSELEIIKQDFERMNAELEKKIEQMEEEKVNLKMDIDVQKLETEGLRKGKRKVEKDLNRLKTDYKRLRLSVKTAGLGKTSEQWRQEVQEEKAKAGRWEGRFQEA